MPREVGAQMPRDKRHLDIGLSDAESVYVINECKKYCNIRDELEDLYQIALIAIYQGFKSKENKNEEIKNRRAFFYNIVKFAMCAQVIRKNKKDLIYKSMNTFEDISEVKGSTGSTESSWDVDILSYFE